jgi:hypothetical protein
MLLHGITASLVEQTEYVVSHWCLGKQEGEDRYDNASARERLFD